MKKKHFVFSKKIETTRIYLSFGAMWAENVCQRIANKKKPNLASARES